MRRLVLITALLGTMLMPAEALAARLALVVGIDAYDMLPPLDKAIGDAEAMSSRLEELGYTVTTVIDPGRREFNQAITEFRRALKPGDTAFVHYSGHGVEVDGRNLLLPRDVPIPTSGDEDYLIAEAIDLNDLMARVADSGADVRVFVIDACRNNPFARRGVRGLGSAGGLAMSVPPSGSFVLYSAGFQQTALDRLGPDDASPTSVYTRVLLERLGTPGASISEIARSVRVDVAALALTVGHEQSPAYYDELSRDFVVNQSAPAAPGSGSIEAEAYDRAKELGTRPAWEAFLKNYPAGVFADLARVALAALPAGEQVPSEADRVLGKFEARQKMESLWREGHALVAAGDDAGAFRLLAEARDIARTTFGENSLEFADASNQIVGGYTGIGEMAAAMDASRAAIAIYTRLFGETNDRVVFEKGNLASRLAATGKVGEALSLYEEILAGFDAAEPRFRNAGYAHILEGYAMTLADSGKIDVAVDYASRAVDLLDQVDPRPSIDDGWLSLNHGRILLKAGRCEEGMTAFDKARAGMEAAGVAVDQRDHADILELLERGCD